MHTEVRDWFKTLKESSPELFKDVSVLEAGSYDINGSVRPYFAEAKEYIGIDWRPGPGVDVVSLVHKFSGRPLGYFDVIVSTSFLEHDPYWKSSLWNMLDLLKAGGTLIITCAGPDFGPHDLDCAPIVDGVEKPYYKGIPFFELVDEVKKDSKFETIVVASEGSLRDTFVIFRGKIPEKKS